MHSTQDIDVQIDFEDDHDERASTMEALSEFRRQPSRGPSIQSQRRKQKRTYQFLRGSYYIALLGRQTENVYALWNSPKAKARRIALHKRIHAVRSSQHLKHGLKCSAGVSLLTLPGHLPASSAGQYLEFQVQSQNFSADALHR
jgi:hypothetical protein